MSTNTELTRRVTTMLRTKADQVTLTDEPFDARRPASIDADLDIDIDIDIDIGSDIDNAEHGVRPRPRLLLAVAGAVLLVGLVVTARAAVHTDEPTVDASAGASWAAHVDGPLIASVDLASATLELHQDGATRILCLRRERGGDLRCSDGLTASLVVDDTWYVAVAQAEGVPAPLIARGWGDPPYTGDPAMPSLDDQALSTETGNDAGWAFTLAAPPPDVDFVWLEQGFTHTKLDRSTPHRSG
jgi:hypothetical protein